MNWLKQPKFQILLDQAIFSATNFLLTIWVARQVDAQSFGLYSVFVLVAFLAVIAISAWTISVFQVAPEQSPNYVSFVCWWQFTIVAVVLAVAIGLNGLFHFFDSYVVYFYITGVVMYDFWRKLFLAQKRIIHALLLDAVTAGLLLIALFLFRALGIKGIQEMIGWITLVNFIAVTMALGLSKPFQLNTADVPSFVRLHLSTGKWLFCTALSQWWASNLFVVAAGVYLGATALGALRLAQSLFGVLNVLLQTFEHYVLPQTAQHLNSNFSFGIQYIKVTNQKLGLVFLPILILAFILAEPIMALASDGMYSPYGFVLRGWCVVYLFVFLAQPVRFVVRSLQLNQHFFYAYLLNLGFSLISSHWLLSQFGLYGTAIGLIAGQTILMAYWIFILQQQKNINVWKSFMSY